MRKLYWINTYLSLWRVLPVYLFYKKNRFHQKTKMDLDAWMRYETSIKGCSEFWAFGYLLVNYKECRNIFLNRLHRNPVMYLITRLFFSPLDSCYINMPPENIGGGFSLQHGFSTIVTAKRIGENCRIFQQVTVGYNGAEAPDIGNNVIITAGAIVIGGIHVGDNVCVGAGSVVTRDIHDGTVVAGVPARPIH